MPKVEKNTYEEFLEANPKIARSGLKYFPFTDQCFWDGKCQRHDCERGFYVKKGRKCLMFELDRCLYDVFGDTGDYDDTNFHIISGEHLDWHVSVNICQSWTSGNTYRFVVNQYCVYRQFRQNELVCAEVGMKPTRLFIANSRNLALVRKYLQEIREKLPEIFKAAEKHFTCKRCQKIEPDMSSLYGEHCVCDDCIPNLVDKYFKQGLQETDR